MGCSITGFSTVFSKMKSSHYRNSSAGHTQSCDLNHVAYIILLIGNLLPALLPLTLQGGAIDLTSFLQQAELSLSRFHPHPHLRPSLGAPSSTCAPILQWVFSASWAIADVDFFLYTKLILIHISRVPPHLRSPQSDTTPPHQVLGLTPHFLTVTRHWQLET